MKLVAHLTDARFQNSLDQPSLVCAQQVQFQNGGTRIHVLVINFGMALW
jgi:hypothetical protein